MGVHKNTQAWNLQRMALWEWRTPWKNLCTSSPNTHTIYILVHYQCKPTVHHACSLFAALSDTSPTNCFHASGLRGAGSTCYLLRRTSPDMHSSMYICQSWFDLRVTLPTPNPRPPQSNSTLTLRQVQSSRLTAAWLRINNYNFKIYCQQLIYPRNGNSPLRPRMAAILLSWQPKVVFYLI